MAKPIARTTAGPHLESVWNDAATQALPSMAEVAPDISFSDLIGAPWQRNLNHPPNQSTKMMIGALTVTNTGILPVIAQRLRRNLSMTLSRN